MRTVVIGSGMSGLTAAAYLAQDGDAVSVFEQYPEIGGVTATIRKGGFGWDLGPLLLDGFGEGEAATLILRELGVDQMVRRVREDRAVSFPDFTLRRPGAYAGPYWRRETLKTLFPRERDGLDRYYRLYDRVMDLLALSRRAEAARGLAAMLLKIRMAVLFQPIRHMQSWSAEKVLDQFFTGRELKALFSGILADFVVRPSEFLGLGIPAVNVETAFDKRIPARVSSAGPRPVYHYVQGGCSTLVEAVASAIRRRGGSIHPGTRVRRILVEDGRVRGLAVGDGGVVEAERVIASGGARETLLGLVGRGPLPPELAADVENVPRMISVLMIHLGIDFDPRPHQPEALCYYYRTYDIEGGVRRCQSGEFHEGREGFLIYIPSLHSPELAPAGMHAVTVYTIAPDRLHHGNWAERREELADRLLAEAESVIPGLRERARTTVVLTPDDFRARTLQDRHSFGGRAPVMGKPLIPHHTPIQGLWFVGAQSESGGGVATVMAGSRKAVAMMRAVGR